MLDQSCFLVKNATESNEGKVMEGTAITGRNRQDIVLTGPGRSGTTLACYLLNKLPNTVGKELRPDFQLIIKQPRLFTALLPTLAKQFPCYAVVRNPLSVMASRRSLKSNKKREGPDLSSKWFAEELKSLGGISHTPSR
jgi:hypothetical protein